jgi:serine/threonine protein kinase
MTWISDAAADHLRAIAEWPDFEGTRYEVAEEIGRGGMGTVFRGRDRDLGREVAIKVAAWAGQPAETRLRQEARVLAALEHPGIVPVHECGRLPDGRAYYVMMLVKGQRLDDRVQQLPLLADRLRLFDRICDIVAFVHARGVLHRDLKPANIMIGAFGEVLILDWGLALTTDRTPPKGTRSTDHAGAGTEGYMAPEQAAGGADVRSDVYSLGAVLRDLTRGTAVAGHRTIRPLESIVRRSTDPDPDARYQDVAALAGDVRQFVDGESVSAHQESLLERAGRFTRSYRTPLMLILGYLIMRALLILFWGR